MNTDPWGYRWGYVWQVGPLDVRLINGLARNDRRAHLHHIEIPGFSGKSPKPLGNQGFFFGCCLAVSGVVTGAPGRRGRGTRVGDGRAPWEARAARPDPGGDRGVRCPRPTRHAACLPMRMSCSSSPSGLAVPAVDDAGGRPASARRRNRAGASARFLCASLTGGAGSTASVQVRGSRGVPGARVGASPVCRYRPRPRQGGAAMVPGVAGGVWWGRVPRSDFPVRSPAWCRSGSTGQGGNANKRYRVNVRGYTFFSVPNRADCPAG